MRACKCVGYGKKAKLLTGHCWARNTSTTDRMMNIPNGLEDDTMTKTYRNLKRK
jgi:hypothetical protein